MYMILLSVESSSPLDSVLAVFQKSLKSSAVAKKRLAWANVVKNLEMTGAKCEILIFL